MKKTLLRVMKDAAWAPISVFVLHVVFARIFGHEPYVDPVIHFLGGAAIAFFFWCCVEAAPGLVGAPTRLAINALVIGLATLAAVLWELGELMSDILLGTNIQHSAPNTRRDLSLGVAGAVVFVIVHCVVPRPPRGAA